MLRIRYTSSYKVVGFKISPREGLKRAAERKERRYGTLEYPYLRSIDFHCGIVYKELTCIKKRFAIYRLIWSISRIKNRRNGKLRPKIYQNLTA